MPRFSAATLSIQSDTDLASAVEAILGLAPDSIHEKGDVRTDRRGRELSPYKYSVWSYSPPKESIDPADDSGFAALRALVKDIRGCADGLAKLRPRYLTAIRWSGEVSAQGNFVIDANLMVDLGLLGCEFWGTAHQEFDPDLDDLAE